MKTVKQTMEHVTIEQMPDGMLMIKPETGYVLVKYNREYSEIVADTTDGIKVRKKGEPAPVPPADPVEKAKRDKIAQIDAYDKSSAVNSFTLNSVPMWLTVEEREQIATQISANEAVGRTDMTKWFGGVAFTFPIALWKQMLVAVEVYAGDALNVTESHKADVMAMDNVEDIAAYDITKGYPPKLVFPYVG